MSDALDHVHELWDPNLSFPVWSNLVDRAAQDRIRLLEDVGEAAAKVCWVDTCPGCQEMWECDPNCTYSLRHPASAEAVRAHRNRFAPLRAALTAAGYEVEA